ncbi:Hydroxyacid oxidase 1 [Anabarilius grahami]|uniref:Hydroxyacid oxidase 1 n=1 Tax=Anabarilius grahami TaxID=495550 RepID=A0A3N0XLR4_ANAGA|nr:Hydroxyacid oxidase 1 [Anabarilius grahami]
MNFISTLPETFLSAPQIKAHQRQQGAIERKRWMANFESPDLAFSSKEGYGEDSGLAVYVTQAIDATVKWDDIAWLKRLTSLPVVVKGVLTAEDAKEALKYGVDGILVSNHGARQLDGVPATIDALPEVVEAVEGKVEVFMDGGIRKGTDVLKALALGAKAVFVGRPVLWALACEGDKGVANVLQLLREELHLALALTDLFGRDLAGGKLQRSVCLFLKYSLWLRPSVYGFSFGFCTLKAFGGSQRGTGCVPLKLRSL